METPYRATKHRQRTMLPPAGPRDPKLDTLPAAPAVPNTHRMDHYQKGADDRTALIIAKLRHFAHVMKYSRERPADLLRSNRPAVGGR